MDYWWSPQEWFILISDVNNILLDRTEEDPIWNKPQVEPRFENILICFSEFWFLCKFWENKTQKMYTNPSWRGPRHLPYLWQPAARFTCPQKLISVINYAYPRKPTFWFFLARWEWFITSNTYDLRGKKKSSTSRFLVAERSHTSLTTNIRHGVFTAEPVCASKHVQQTRLFTFISVSQRITKQQSSGNKHKQTNNTQHIWQNESSHLKCK